MGKMCYLCRREASKQDQISLHRFPTDPITRNKWIKACDVLQSDDFSYVFICTTHFNPKDVVYRGTQVRCTLRPGAVPSIGVPNPIIENVTAVNDVTESNPKPNESEMSNTSENVLGLNRLGTTQLSTHGSKDEYHDFLKGFGLVAATPPEDEDSVKGHFGWTTINKVNIPYLQRSGVKIVSVDMIKEARVFDSYCRWFNNEVFSCYQLPKFNATKAEASLLEEINSNHCDGYYGRHMFKKGDILVLLDDLVELENFLKFCYIKLVKKDTDPQPPLSFVKLSPETCVPYVLHCDKKYVPLFYFEGDAEYLEEKAVDIKDWSLYYFRLACKLQGIREDLYNNDTLQVVDLELVKEGFPPDTPFDELWPCDTNTDHLLVKPDTLTTCQNNERRYDPSTPSFQNTYIQNLGISDKVLRTRSTAKHRSNGKYISDRYPYLGRSDCLQDQHINANRQFI